MCVNPRVLMGGCALFFSFRSLGRPSLNPLSWNRVSLMVALCWYEQVAIPNETVKNLFLCYSHVQFGCLYMGFFLSNR